MYSILSIINNNERFFKKEERNRIKQIKIEPTSQQIRFILFFCRIVIETDTNKIKMLISLVVALCYGSVSSPSAVTILDGIDMGL